MTPSMPFIKRLSMVSFCASVGYNSQTIAESFWENLLAETAFLARVLVEKYSSEKEDSKLDNILPVVTKLSDIIALKSEEILAQNSSSNDSEFILGELLKIAVNVDYSDESGRRRMFQHVRTSIQCCVYLQ